MKKLLAGLIVTLSACGVIYPTGASWAQQVVAVGPAAPSATYEERKRETNENVVTIIASDTKSPYTIFAEDMRNVLDQSKVPGGLRVLPILGRGGGQNAVDVLLLRGVDMGIVEASDVEIARKKDPAVFANAENRLHYIAKLANSEFQILALNEIKTRKGFGRAKKSTASRMAARRNLPVSGSSGSCISISTRSITIRRSQMRR